MLSPSPRPLQQVIPVPAPKPPAPVPTSGNAYFTPEELKAYGAYTMTLPYNTPITGNEPDPSPGLFSKLLPYIEAGSDEIVRPSDPYYVTGTEEKIREEAVAGAPTVPGALSQAAAQQQIDRESMQATVTKYYGSSLPNEGSKTSTENSELAKQESEGWDWGKIADIFGGIAVGGATAATAYYQNKAVAAQAEALMKQQQQQQQLMYQQQPVQPQQSISPYWWLVPAAIGVGAVAILAARR